MKKVLYAQNLNLFNIKISSMKFVTIFSIIFSLSLITSNKKKNTKMKKILPVLIGDDCEYSEKKDECNRGLVCHRFKLVCLIKNGETCYNSSDCLSGFCNKLMHICSDFSSRYDFYI